MINIIIKYLVYFDFIARYVVLKIRILTFMFRIQCTQLKLIDITKIFTFFILLALCSCIHTQKSEVYESLLKSQELLKYFGIGLL